MHTDNPNLIKDRKHHFRSYQCCFIGRDVVRWLVNTGQAPDRDTATHLMNILLNNNVFHQGLYTFYCRRSYQGFQKNFELASAQQ